MPNPDFNFFFTVRQLNGDTFDDHQVGKTHYLKAPAGAGDLLKEFIIADRNVWLDDILTSTKEDILIYIHGYNSKVNDIINNHNAIKKGLTQQGFVGEIISFDWPCGDNALMYLPDRQTAKKTAMILVNGGIMLLSERQSDKCTINIHLLAHSTGAFVVREAFDDADDHTQKLNNNWIVSQLMFIAGDVSSSSMNQPGECDSIYNHTIRLTNYFNPYDSVLALSNLKRLGFENRAGRVGLPPGAPAKCVDVNCGNYYQTITVPEGQPFYSHGWFFDPVNNNEFIKDMLGTINGNVDRSVMPTRRIIDGKLYLLAVRPDE